MSEIIKTPRAKQDLIDLAAYLYFADPASDVSERFLTAAENAFSRLADMPGIGASYSFSGSQMGLRRWPVPGFRNYLIFYHPIENGVEIIRVLHAARDIAAALAEDDTGQDS